MIEVNEIFVSFEGEGIEVGRKKIFLRLAGCNLKCTYCDTDYSVRCKVKGERLLSWLKNLGEKENVKYLTITGGEPLLQVDELNKIVPELRKNFFITLETNGTLPDNFEKLKKVDFVSLDIKIPSSSGYDFFSETKRFVKILKKRNIEYQLKFIFDRNTKIDELKRALTLRSKIFILQPVFKKYVDVDYKKWLKFSKIAINYSKDVRLIPQVHKYLGIK